MVTFTTNQIVILLLMLVLGWLLGLLSRSGGARWRHSWQEEKASREAADARAAAAEARLAEVERVVASRPAAAPAATTAATPAADGRDDLALIHGIGPSGEARLNELGIRRYHQIAELTAREEADLEERIGIRPGTIEHEQWREQARLLAHGDLDEHRNRYRA